MNGAYIHKHCKVSAQTQNRTVKNNIAAMKEGPSTGEPIGLWMYATQS